MEIRGLGIINIKDLFGISAVREAKKIELVVELHEWDASDEYDRLGFDDQLEHMLDVAVPEAAAAGAAGPQPRDADRGRRAQPAAQAPGHPLGARVSRSAASRDGASDATRVAGRGGVDADRHRHRAVGRRQEHRAARARGHRVLPASTTSRCRSSRRWSITSRTRATATSSRSRSTRASAATSPRGSATLAKLRGAGHRLEVMFLDASDEVLLRRFSETRRRHPLSGDDLIDGDPPRSRADGRAARTARRSSTRRTSTCTSSRRSSRIATAAPASSPSRSCRSASSTACRSSSTSCSTCGSCRTRTSSRR